MAVLVAGLASATTLLVSGSAGRTSAAGQTQPGAATVRLVPAELEDTTWLQRLKEAQVREMAGVQRVP